MKEYRTEINQITLRAEKKEELKQLYRQEHTAKAAARTKAKHIRARRAAIYCITAGVAAACVVTAVRGGGIADGILNRSGINSGLQLSVSNNNTFTMIVNAQELENGVKALTSKGYGGGAYIGADKVNNTVEYSIHVPLQCEGENIERITYSINNGAFQVEEKAGERVIVGGVPCEEMNVGSLFMGTISESSEYIENYYTMFTVEYDNQGTGVMGVNICNVVSDSDSAIRDLIWADDDDTLEKECEGYKKMLGDTVITCIVEYKDGSAQSSQIEIGNTAASWNEIGQPERAKEDPNETVHFVTFEMADGTLVSFTAEEGFTKPDGYVDYVTNVLSEKESALLAALAEAKNAAYDGNGNRIFKVDNVSYHVPVYDEHIQGLLDLEEHMAIVTDADEFYYVNKQLAAEAMPSGTISADRNQAFSTIQIGKNRRTTGSTDTKTDAWKLYKADFTASGDSQKVYRVEHGCYQYNSENKIQFEKADVMAYTFALYEDIQDMATVTYSVYGVTQENVDAYLINDGYLDYIRYDKDSAYADYIAGADTMTKVGSWNVEKSGVYYIDLTSVSGNEDYVDYVVVIEMQSYSDDYTFRIASDYTYTITDKAAFEKWKTENKEWVFE